MWLLWLLLLIVHINGWIYYSNTQIKKLKDVVENNTRTTLRIISKMFDGNNLPHELL